VISSAWTVYNELAATRPDLIHVLSASDWPFDTCVLLLLLPSSLLTHRESMMITEVTQY
jgi:hypothetical protein